MRFEFATATRIIFGPGTVAELPSLAAGFGKRAMVVTGKDKIRHASLIAALEGAGFHCTLFSSCGEPSIESVRQGAAALRESKCNVVIAAGGGSAIDAGKAVAALAANPADVLEYIEIVGRGKPLTNAPIPFIAVPTTAGTGAEVTRNAVLGSKEHRVKASLRSPMMLARIALIDPELTFALPREMTAASGLDALTQLIEPYVSSRSNPVTDALCRDGLQAAARSLPRAFANGRDAEARAGMSYASLLGGLALSNAGLGAVHGFAGPIGGMFDAPHGAVCGALLPHAMQVNIRALRDRSPESTALMRYREIARILTGSEEATADDGTEWVATLVRQLGVPPLSYYGVQDTDVPELARKAAAASSMKANPIVLTADELKTLVEAAC